MAMFVVLILFELAAIVLIIAEIYLGIAVTGWQGEKPYVERQIQPLHFWCMIGLHTIFGLGLPGLLLYFQLK